MSALLHITDRAASDDARLPCMHIVQMDLLY